MSILLVVIVAVVAGVIGFLVGCVTTKRIEREHAKEIRIRKRAGFADLYKLLDSGMLQIVSKTDPKLVLRNMTCGFINVGSLGINLRPSEEIKVDDPKGDASWL